MATLPHKRGGGRDGESFDPQPNAIDQNLKHPIGNLKKGTTIFQWLFGRSIVTNLGGKGLGIHFFQLGTYIDVL